MKKNNLLKTVLLFVFTFLFLQGCRNENVFENSKQDLTKKIKISVIENNNIIKNTKVFEEITKIQKEKLNKKSYGKTIQDSVLEGATILTENVMLAEEGEKKTYTFQLKRSYKTSKIENLVLKKNADSTYSGILIQYDITPEEKELFVDGHDVDLKNKIKIYDINKIKLSSRTEIEVIGCYEITWELGWCSAQKHLSGHDSDCTAGGAPKPVIVAITFTCGDNGGGGSAGNDSGTNDPSFPSDDNSSSGGISDYNTTPYIGTFEEYQAYLLELNRVFRLKLNSSQLSWYDANTNLSIELAKLYNQDSSLENLNFLKSLIDFTKSSPEDNLYLYVEALSLLNSEGLNSQSRYTINETIAEWNNPKAIKPTLKFMKNERLKCIYDKIKKIDQFNNILQKFDSKFSTKDLIFDVGTVSNESYVAETTAIGNKVKIKFNENLITSKSNLFLITTFIHEAIHAEIYRILMEKISYEQTNGGVTATYTKEELKNYLVEKKYYKLWDYFSLYGNGMFQHEYMANFKVNTMVNFLSTYDNSLSSETKNAFAWITLMDTIAWKNLSEDQQKKYQKDYIDYEKTGSKNCN